MKKDFNKRIMDRHRHLIVFGAVTLVFVLIRWLAFEGYNGTDDLHYAMLSAKMIRGQYDPFQPNDIYSGRILLIAWQAMIYKIGGISCFTTAVGTVFVTILSCLLTIHKILPDKNAGTVILASSLFYFDPALSGPLAGIMPDPYVMLMGIFIFLLLKRILQESNERRTSVANSALIGSLIALSLLIKETSIVFLPFTLFTLLIHGLRRHGRNMLWVLFSFTLIILLLAFGYYYFCGNVFIKVLQIKNSSYPNPCNFCFLPVKYLLIRLTYGIWAYFITQGFYPIILGALVLAFKLFLGQKSGLKKDIETTSFFLLLAISLYFPFSLDGYQPLCSDTRQFLFLIPFAVTTVATFLHFSFQTGRGKALFAFGSLLVLLVCVYFTRNKWQWMIYSLLFIWFLSVAVLKVRFFSTILYYLLPSLILLFSTFEGFFFHNKKWFGNMQELSKAIHSNCYYFPDHDNMMHWKFLHHFNDSTISYYNLEREPFKIFKLYYQQPDSESFYPGWLVVNKAYNASSKIFLAKVDSLQRTGYFSQSEVSGDVGGYLIDSKLKLDYIKSIAGQPAE